MTASVKSFWSGGELSPYERLSIRSFLDHGFGYQLYTYEDIELPPGAERQDAATILPKTRMFHVKAGEGVGSVAPFSDLFRYELLLQRGGWWVDTDVICLKPDLPASECFFAWEASQIVNCAVMKFPAGHEVMRRCRDKAWRKKSVARWGSTGPELLTAVLRENGLLDCAAAASSCYAVDWRDILDFYDPDRAQNVRRATSESFAVHLWNEIIRRAQLNKAMAAPRHSFLDELFVRRGVGFPSEARYDFPEIAELERLRRLAEAEMRNNHSADSP